VFSTCCFIFSGVVRKTARLANGDAVRSKLTFASLLPPLFLEASVGRPVVLPSFRLQGYGGGWVVAVALVRTSGMVGARHGGALGGAAFGAICAEPLGRCSANSASHVVVVVLSCVAVLLGTFVLALLASWRHFRPGMAGSALRVRSLLMPGRSC
jgi:hypothetical protein